MSWLKRNWTPEAANRWSKEDWIATAFSVASYLLVALGATLSLLAMPVGYALLAAGVVSAWMMYRVIDPKLRAVSAEYERKQGEYQARMERLTRWEKHE